MPYSSGVLSTRLWYLITTFIVATCAAPSRRDLGARELGNPVTLTLHFNGDDQPKTFASAGNIQLFDVFGPADAQWGEMTISDPHMRCEMHTTVQPNYIPIQFTEKKFAADFGGTISINPKGGWYLSCAEYDDPDAGVSNALKPEAWQKYCHARQVLGRDQDPHCPPPS